MKKLVTVLCICCLMLGLTACGKRGPQKMSITFDANPSTGYMWDVEQSEEIFKIQDTIVSDSDEEWDGGSGKDVFSFIPEKAGTVDLTFTYARSGEEESEDNLVISYTIKVDDRMQISVESSRLSGGNDMNELPQIPEPVIEVNK